MRIAAIAAPMLPRQGLRRVCGLAALALAGALSGGTCAAQLQATAVPPPPRLQSAVAPETPVAPASAASAPARAASPRTHVVVIEDDEVRIEETRVRGLTQRIVVQSKLPGARPYEIIVGPGGKDSSQDRGATGQRAWSLFAF